MKPARRDAQVQRFMTVPGVGASYYAQHISLEPPPRREHPYPIALTTDMRITTRQSAIVGTGTTLLDLLLRFRLFGASLQIAPQKVVGRRVRRWVMADELRGLLRCQ